MTDQRRLQRVTLLDPVRGTLGAQRIYLLDASLSGLKIAHQEAIGAVGTSSILRAQWDGRTIELKCIVVRSEAKSKTLFHSGLAIASALGDSAAVLRDLIEAHVARALDEQKANARGVAALNPQSFQTGRAPHFVRHELLIGRWRETVTMDNAQPESGFTVAGTHSPREVEMLRSAYERGDKALIRRLAAMSISTPEGIPTRRFLP